MTGISAPAGVSPPRVRRRVVRSAVAVVGWVVLLPLRLLGAAAAAVLRAGGQLCLLPVRALRLAARRLGLVGTAALLLGIGVGLLVAPVSGRQLRSRMRTLAAGAGVVPDEEVRMAVREELAGAPRTWHLPQPEVVVHGGVVTLRGSVPHDTARLEVEAAAAGVRGVQGIVNELQVA